MDWSTSNWKYSFEQTPQIWKELSEFWNAQVNVGFVLSQEIIDDDDPISVGSQGLACPNATSTCDHSYVSFGASIVI
ncbi:MAG: hypothetical protein ABSA92_09080 [Candidatus Bathyarchaeia archaeon]